MCFFKILKAWKIRLKPKSLFIFTIYQKFIHFHYIPYVNRTALHAFSLSWHLCRPYTVLKWIYTLECNMNPWKRKLRIMHENLIVKITRFEPNWRKIKLKWALVHLHFRQNLHKLNYIIGLLTYYFCIWRTVTIIINYRQNFTYTCMLH